ncbi:MAG TPA: ribonuclease P protein component [Rhodocyclaceae bacterium]|nr:ribonuclease P protein component [Betaproteobacteria bacterium]HMV00525.1 ribonuclease P protein component [Rhodocyclaceae bacterium]HNE43443.1 ribonuclease P protein component [Rhodocyclaceae bacterium]HNL21722.1 ribonuclease P protein component [Rhodocyclaceae bacterium]HNM23391.1 ribonuclease P protein component [Rhodocyclaceae bacterium]
MSAAAAAPSVGAFPRRYRLTKTDEYSSVFGFRRAIRGTLFMVHYRPRGADGTDARLGLVIGRKQVKSAVGRNRIKRILREQFRLRRSGLPSLDVVFRLMVKPGRIDGRLVAREALDLMARLPRKAISEGG